MGARSRRQSFSHRTHGGNQRGISRLRRRRRLSQGAILERRRMALAGNRRFAGAGEILGEILQQRFRQKLRSIRFWCAKRSSRLLASRRERWLAATGLRQFRSPERKFASYPCELV